MSLLEETEPVRSGTLLRKSNSTLDQDGILMERVRELRNRRRGFLSCITTKRKEIDDLLNDVNNLEPVRVKLSELTDVFRKFVEAHNAYNSELVDDTQIGKNQMSTLPKLKQV